MGTGSDGDKGLGSWNTTLEINVIIQYPACFKNKQKIALKELGLFKEFMDPLYYKKPTVPTCSPV